MDADFDRTVRYHEFMEFFLVLWVARLKNLRKDSLHPPKDLAPRVAKMYRVEAKKRLRKAEHAIKLTFGSGYMAAAARAGAVLPGAFSSLMKKVGMDQTAVRASFIPMSPHGQERIQRARNRMISGSAAGPPLSPVRTMHPDAEEPLQAVPPDGARKTQSGEKRENVSRTQSIIPGRATLNRMKMAGKNKEMRGEADGPVRRDFGRHGVREIGRPKRTDAFAAMPKRYVPN